MFVVCLHVDDVCLLCIVGCLLIAYCCIVSGVERLQRVARCALLAALARCVLCVAGCAVAVVV